MSGFEQVLGPPDRDARAAAGGAGIPSSGKISLHQLRKPWSNSLARRSRRRRTGSRPARRIRGCFAWPAENSGTWWPLKKMIGAWSRSCTDGTAGIDDLPGQQALPVARDDIRRCCGRRRGRCSSRRPGGGASLLTSTGGAALGQEQQGEARRQDRVALVQRHPARTRESLSWLVDELLGAQAIPVVLAEEPHAGQPAGALQPVEIVDTSIAGRCRSSRSTWKCAGQPVDTRAEAGVDVRPCRSS